MKHLDTAGFESSGSPDGGQFRTALCMLLTTIGVAALQSTAAL